MENEKKQPNNFKDAALSHIPFELLQSMKQQATISADDMKSLHDTVLEKGPAIRSTVPGVQPSPPLLNNTPVPASLSYVINGHVILVPREEIGAAIMMFYTLLAFVWGKDKNVAKILKQFDFKFFDANNVQIYPIVKKRARK